MHRGDRQKWLIAALTGKKALSRPERGEGARQRKERKEIQAGEVAELAGYPRRARGLQIVVVDD
jgi:hypothetical protein